MSADVLRRAAALMRERAEAARAGRWQTADSMLAPDARLVVADWEHEPRRVATCAGSLPEGNEANAEHIASWHPAVALAVARLLDHMADLGDIDPSMIPHTGRGRALVDVANAYLGGQA